MFKETMPYVDYNGNNRTEDIYFDLSEQEVTELQFGTYGGLNKLLERIVQTQDEPELIKIFKMIMDKAYGVKSDDGRFFRKNQQNLEDFQSTKMYSDFYMKLARDDVYAAKFINAVFPAELTKDIGVVSGTAPQAIPIPSQVMKTELEELRPQGK